MRIRHVLDRAAHRRWTIPSSLRSQIPGSLAGGRKTSHRAHSSEGRFCTSRKRERWTRWSAKSIRWTFRATGGMRWPPCACRTDCGAIASCPVPGGAPVPEHHARERAQSCSCGAVDGPSGPGAIAGTGAINGGGRPARRPELCYRRLASPDGNSVAPERAPAAPFRNDDRKPGPAGRVRKLRTNPGSLLNGLPAVLTTVRAATSRPRDPWRTEPGPPARCPRALVPEGREVSAAAGEAGDDARCRPNADAKHQPLPEEPSAGGVT
jgi:hypothetical protein